jgi:Tol biopolymer transport system component
MSRAGLSVGAVLLGLLVGCGGENAEPRVSPSGAPLTAGEQRAARLLAVRLQPGNPPRSALLSLRDDGANVRVLAKAPAGAIRRIGSPEWSPDGRVYFIGVLDERAGDRFTYSEADVFSVEASGGDPRRITTSRDLTAVVPAPDGRTLVAARDEHPGKRPLTFGLWLMDSDGGHLRRLLDAEDGQLDLPGSWSPDGKTIAFARCPFQLPDEHGLVENTCAIYTVSADGSGLRKLADRSDQPAFSVDGRRIAFVSDRDEHGKHATGSDEEAFANELYVMDADGGNQRRLSKTESLDESAPAWSPDGSRIAFAREGPARFSDQLMVARADGTCSTRVIGDAADEEAPWFSLPAWRPGRLAGDLAPLACD